MRQGRSFLLLEVVIAFAVVAACAVPLIRQPILYYKAQINSLKESDLQRLADLAFCEVKESLLQQTIPWKKLPGKKAKPLEILLGDAKMSLPHFSEKIVSRSCKLSCQREKKGAKGEVFRLYKAIIELNGKERFSYRIALQATSQSP